MFAEIHLPLGVEVDRDDVEEAVTEAIEGIGEVSGAGVGVFGSNLDLELRAGLDREALVATLREALRVLGVSGATIRFDADPSSTLL